MTGATAATCSLASLAFAAWWRGGFVPGLDVGAALACATVARVTGSQATPHRATGGAGRQLTLLLALATIWCLLPLLPLPAGVRSWLAPGATALDTELGRPAELGPLTPDPAASRSALLALTLGGALVAAARAIALAPEQRRRLLQAIVVVAAAVAAVGVVEVFLGRPLLRTELPPHARPFGPFANRNHAGLLLVLALPLAAAVTPRTALRPATITLLLLGLLLNGSRGALLAAVGIGLFALATGRGATRLRWLGGAALLALLVLPSHAWQRRGDAATVDERLALAGDALRMAADAPLTGIGLGAFCTAYPPYQTVARDLRFRHAECEPLELLVEGGVPLLLLALLAGAVLVRTAWRVARHPAASGTGRALATSALALPLHACVDFPLRVPGVALPFALIVGALLAAAEERR